MGIDRTRKKAKASLFCPSLLSLRLFLGDSLHSDLAANSEKYKKEQGKY
jgi:hypothetical protein